MMILTALSTSLMAFVGGGWFLFPLFPLFWLLVIVAIVLLARGRGAAAWTGGGRETAIDLLERRFAEGELSLEQYRERRSVLEEKR
jgi:putative membrane protein